MQRVPLFSHLKHCISSGIKGLRNALLKLIARTAAVWGSSIPRSPQLLTMAARPGMDAAQDSVRIYGTPGTLYARCGGFLRHLGAWRKLINFCIKLEKTDQSGVYVRDLRTCENVISEFPTQ